MKTVAVSNKDGVTPHGGAPVVVAGAIPFTAAAHHHQEPAFRTPAKILTAGTQQLDPINVPSFGYLRHIFLDVVSTAGVIGPGVLHEDAPWSIIQSLTLLDVNGAPIVGPVDGFGLYLANLVGGYAFQNDPALWPGFTTTDAGNPSFQLRVPLEIAAHNALGSIANQNAAAPYQLMITLNQISGVYSTAPTTAPTITITGTLETWTLPAAENDGVPQNQLPPAHGTGQFLSSRNNTGLAAGDNTIPINRVGSLLRHVIFVFRNATPVRSDTVPPDPFILNWDGRQSVNEPKRYRQSLNFQKIGKRLTGVYVYGYNDTNNGKVGDESPNLWLPTQQSTRLELNGNFGAAGSAQVIVTDVQPIEVQPDQRYVEDNATAPGVGA